ncbi:MULTISPECIES: hypothetical protein [Alicyclobacillus]|uniref:Uncharacterized protein n=1 Tax=Alicyclobacillus acidocaldarius subsp. acidocaldarius (strain ATCC 27009 / DSM 446 / BCRC 14685 / JCM 5260 / KCTC 1825 / NBRC 15652 / NCIMB 11725 / NRRL B-14509 / 104-IA) TaxID=521098 RepID=C8WVQ6_ALIAD|nr:MULTISPECIES: hypothetical protein [Alicyclobacillus]ACV58178.1 hypothetical protein Aaci_1145 [Alicyclobacillus acidocaldarius subsp. acidocaldarius DSM 446]
MTELEILALRLACKARIERDGTVTVPLDDVITLRRVLIDEMTRKLTAMGWTESAREDGRVVMYSKGDRGVWLLLNPTFADWGIRMSEAIRELIWR